MAVRKEEVRVSADVSNFVTKMAAAGAAAGGFADRLDAADGRMSNLVQTGLALAPALVPLGAAVVPAIAGIANQLGVATLAAGATVLAFQGVGTALKAIDAFKLDPTTANFQKLQQAMDELGPAAAEFALFIDKVQPKFATLQKTAAQGLFPGLESGIRQLMPLLPEANRVIFSLTSTLGDLVATGAKNLNSDKWQSFFTFLEADASVTLQSMGKSLGNLAQGFAELWQAFNPLSQGFNQGFLSMSRSFNDWAAGLSKTQGFQDFLAYIQKSGPEALHALGAVGDALLQIVEAAAPVGSVALPAITAVAHAISSLADSSVGPTLIAVAAAVGVLGRSLALLQTAGLRGGGTGFIATNYVAPFKQLPGVMRAAQTATTNFATAESRAKEAHRSYIASLKVSSTNLELLGAGASPASSMTKRSQALRIENDRAAKSAKQLAEAERAKGAALRESAGAFGKGIAGAAGLAFATSGLADHFKLSNTASLALMGTIVGPWGTAIGGAVGLVKDLSSANDDLEASSKASATALSSSAVGFAQQGALLRRTRSDFEDYSHSVNRAGNIGSKSFGDMFNAAADLFTNTKNEQKKSVDSQIADYKRMGTNVAQVYSDLSGGSRDLFGGTAEQLDNFVNHITPALAKAGIDVNKFKKAAAGSDLRIRGEAAIQSYFKSFDSASGKSREVAKALRELGGEMDSNVNQASKLKAALDNLFGVELNQSQATDQAVRALRDMRKAVSAAGKALLSNSGAALDARDSIRSYVSAQLDKVNADAAADGSGRKAAETLLATRDNIVSAAKAAGLGARAISRLTAQLGLTPKNFSIIINSSDVLSATEKVKALARVYRLTPKQVRTVVAAIGAGKSESQIRALLKTYGLTPKQVTTLLKAIDQASAKARAAKKAHEAFAKAYKAYLNSDDNASAKSKAARANALAFAKKYLAALLADNRTGPGVAAARALVNSLRDKTITITTNLVTHHSSSHGPTGGKPLPSATSGGGAAGRIWRNFAAGDIANAHQPVIERMPTYRMWAEPETKGEAYIPLANDWRRPRAVAIWEQTGRLLGQYAAGAMVNAAPSPIVVKVPVETNAGMNVHYNAPVYAHDPDGLARKLDARNRTAAALAGAP